MTSSRRSRRDVASLWPHHTKRNLDEQKREAGQAVTRAIASGELKRGPCAKCGTNIRVEGHHEDYAKPLDVIWLCRYHHRLRHVEMRAVATALRREQKTAQRATVVRRRYVAHLNSSASVPVLIKSATTAIADAMDFEGINEAELANLLGSSRQSLNAGFAGGFRTLKSIAAIADAMGYEARVVLTKRHATAEVA
jgi:hypothetical protein